MKIKNSIINRIDNMPRGVKSSAAFFLASVVSMGINYITTPLYTRLLSPEEYGKAAIFLAWVNVFAIFATFNLSSGVFNNGMLDYPNNRDEYSYSMLVLSNIITVCFFCLLFVLYPVIKPWLGVDFPLIILMEALFLFQPAYQFWSAKQRYELKYRLSFFWSAVTAVLSPTVAIICIFIFNGHRLYARIFGAQLTLIAIYIGFYLYLAIKNKFKVQKKYWKGALLFNLPLIPHYLSMYLLGSSDKLMISNLVGDSAVAYYSVAHMISSVATVIWGAANGSFIPYTYEKCNSKDYRSISMVAMRILIVFAAACIAVIMLAPEVVNSIASPDYREAIYVIPPIVGGSFFSVHYAMYGNILFYYKKPKYATMATVTSALLNIILNYVFIQKFGYIAAGYTTLVCYFVQATLDYIIMRMVVGVDVYDMKCIGALSLFVIIVALFSNFIYDYAFIRYVIIGVLIISCIVFRRKIMDIFDLMKRKQ